MMNKLLIAGAALLLPVMPALAAPTATDFNVSTDQINYLGIGSSVGAANALSINDANSGPIGGGIDHYDQALGTFINGSPFVDTGTLDLVDNGGSFSIDSGLQAFGDVDVRVGYRLFDGTPVARQLVTFTNGGAATTLSVHWSSNSGADSAHVVVASSTGDLLATTADRWVTTADSADPLDTDSENNVFVFGGGAAGFLMPTTVTLFDERTDFGGAGDEGLSAFFDLALGAGETASLLFFVGNPGGNALGGLTFGELFNDVGSSYFQGLIGDLSATERDQVRNFNFGVVDPAPAPATIALFGLGLVGLASRRRKS